MTKQQDRTSLRAEIAHALNVHSAENGSDTPDFILARFLTDCLDAYDRAVRDRDSHRRTFLENVAAEVVSLEGKCVLAVTIPNGLDDHEAALYLDQIRKRLVAHLPDEETSITILPVREGRTLEALDEEQMRRAGWVRTADGVTI